MAGDTRTLTVSLVAEVASLRKGMKEAQGHLAGLQRASQTTARIMKTAFGAAAIGFAFNKIENGIRNAINVFEETGGMIEDTKHLAEALGQSTEDVQALSKAAAEAEVPIEMLQKNLRVMTRTLGLASMGTGPAVKALDELGLSASDLIHMNVSDQIDQIARGIGRIGTQAQKAAIVQSIFGKTGFDMLPFIEESAGKIAELRHEMELTGELFTYEEASIVDAAGDAVGRMKGFYQGLKNQLVIQLAPSIKYVADLLRGMAVAAGGARPLAAIAIEYMVSAAARLANGLQTVYSWWYKIKGGILMTTSAIARTLGVIGSVINGVLIGDFTQLINLFNIGAQTLKLGLLGALYALAVGFDHFIEGLPAIFGGKKKSTISNPLAKMITESQNQLDDSYNALISGGFGKEFADSLAGEAGAAFDRSADVAGGSWGKTFTEKWKEMQSTAFETSPAKAMADEAYDIIAPLQKQKEAQEGIFGELQKQQDIREDIQQDAKKDAGEFTSIRAGEGLAFRGSVSNNYRAPVNGAMAGMGGGEGTGGISDARKAELRALAIKNARAQFAASNPELASMMAKKGGTQFAAGNADSTPYAARSAAVANNGRTGPDAVIPLLSSILQAVQQTASNTARAQVPVAA